MQIDKKILQSIIKRILIAGLLGQIIALITITFSYLFFVIFKSAFLVIFAWAGITAVVATWLSITIIATGPLVLLLALYIEGLTPGE